MGKVTAKKGTFLKKRALARLDKPVDFSLKGRTAITTSGTTCTATVVLV